MRSVLTVAGTGILMLFSLAFVLADQASASDGPLCTTSAGFLPKLCVSIPLPATARRDDAIQTTIAMRQIVAASHADVTRRTDVAIGQDASSDVLALSARFGTESDIPSEPERAQVEARSLERVFDIADLRAYARDAAIRQGIDPVLFVRQINAESAFDPNAVSKAGAVGIAQIMPALHPEVDPTDPYASLDYAARLMRGYIVHFGDWQRALIAYNAGPGRLMPGNPAYLPTVTLLSDAFGGGETKRYVARILGR
jgi:soluble lytic murein transglycosylase-like protein